MSAEFYRERSQVSGHHVTHIIVGTNVSCTGTEALKIICIYHISFELLFIHDKVCHE